MGSIHDILAYDDTLEECWYAYATIRDRGNTKIYWIPREWLKQIVVNKNGNFVLMPFEFCCRQVLKRTDCKLVQCQSHTIPERLFVDQYFFHVGCGPCHTETLTVIANLPIFVGLKQLAMMLEDETVTKNAEHLLVALINEDVALNYIKLEKNETGGINKTMNIDLTSDYLRDILQHILMCKKCNGGLRKFLCLLEECVVRTNPYPDYEVIWYANFTTTINYHVIYL
jgi:hypothetical protein